MSYCQVTCRFVALTTDKHIHCERFRVLIEPQAIAVSPYGWLMTHYGWLAGLSQLAMVSMAAA